MSNHMKALAAVLTAAVIVATGAILVASITPHSATASEASQIDKAAIDSVIADGMASRFEPGWAIGKLSSVQQTQIKSRIRSELSSVYTGDLLTAKLSQFLGWVVPAGRGDAPRRVAFRVEEFDVQSRSISGQSATLVATYRIYYKNAQAATDKATDQVWAGWVTYQATFSLQKPDNKWLVSGLSQYEIAEAADTSIPALVLPQSNGGLAKPTSVPQPVVP